MSWEDLITHMLATTSKVEKIAVFDCKGRPVAVTEDTEISQSEGQAIINCLSDPAKTMTKLHIEDDVYLCIQGIDRSFIGTSIRNHARVIVAREEGDHVITVFGQSSGQGSFIFELKQGLLLRAEGKLLGQQEMQRQSLLLPPEPGSPVQDSQSPISSEQVLVDLA